MQPVLQFLEVWVGWVALAGAFFATSIWLLSMDGNRKSKAAASSLLGSFFWPIVWLYSQLTMRASTRMTAHAIPSRMLGEAETTVTGANTHFTTIRGAKDYLASQIAQQAERDGVPLTEVERKMLYFTETGWTLPDMKKVSAEFDKDYDQPTYEQRIGGLIDRIQSNAKLQNQRDQQTWNAAVKKLSNGDHYLLVLVDGAVSVPRGAKHNLKILFIAAALFALAAVDMAFKQWMRQH